MDIRLPEKHTATTNSIFVALKAFGGSLIALVTTIVLMPEVQAVIIDYVKNNLAQLLTTLAVVIGSGSLGTGLINLLLDIKKKGVQNY